MEMSETPSSIAVNSTAATFGDDAGHQDVAIPDSANATISAAATATETHATPRSDHASLLAELMASVPANYDAELQNDPNFADFVRFHNLVKDFEPVESGAGATGTGTGTGNYLRPIPKYNWDVLSSAFEHVYKLYTNEINDILADFDRLDIKRSIWQESAFRMDGERASRRFRSIESWISDSDLYLNVSRKDLSSSVQIIRHTLDKLNNPSPPRDDDDAAGAPDAETTPHAHTSTPTPI